MEDTPKDAPQPTTSTPQPVIAPVITPQTPRTKHTRRLIWGSILAIVFIVGVVSLFVRQNNASKVITSQTIDKNGTIFTSYQYDESTNKTYKNTCFSTKIPSSAKVESRSGDNCSLQITMPDTTLPYVNVVAITESDPTTTEQAAKSAKQMADQEFFASGKTDQEALIVANTNIGGLNSYQLNYTDGTYGYKSYFIDVPFSKGFFANNERVKGFYVEGFQNKNTNDVFTKYYDLFIRNLKFN